VEGVARFAADPEAPENAGITDLRLADRDRDGCVRFEADVCVLRPADPAHASGRLLFVVSNRGRRSNVPFSVLAAPPPAEVTERIDPGDGFLLKRGWAIAWCGWQWDVVRRPGALGLAAPLARLPAGDRDGRVTVQFQPHVEEAHHGLGHWPLDPPPGAVAITHAPLRPADLDDPDAVLSVREHPRAETVALPRASWRFGPDGATVWLASGFQPGLVYELRYRPAECPVAGAGLLAVRDFVSALRHGPEEARIAGRVEHALAIGVSQTGRFLRDLLHRGLNVDGAGRRVFDGLVIQVAGARRGEFAQRYGQPSVQHVPGLGHLPPFLDGSVFEPQRARGGMPRVFTINTASEYWRVQASLTHMDEAGAADVSPPAEARSYLLAGCQHVPGPPALTRSPLSSPWVRPANHLTTVDHTPALRAALVNLERWVAEDVEPPPSAVPRLADGTAVARGDVLGFFASVPGMALAREDRLPELPRLDLGDRTAEGVVGTPAAAGEPYRGLVSAVDGSGNEVAGIRLPDVAVPLASHTGWNPRAAGAGAEGQLLDMLGSSVPLPRTRAEREAAGDPRPSIEERYADRDDYLRQVRAEAERLVAARHLLAEDVDLVVARAGRSWDEVTRSSSQEG
jgi:Alpha/beta hydrolase domain